MAAVDKPRNIDYKGKADLVTESDRNTELVILEGVRQKFLDHLILGEDGGVIWASPSWMNNSFFFRKLLENSSASTGMNHCVTSYFGNTDAGTFVIIQNLQGFTSAKIGKLKHLYRLKERGSSSLRNNLGIETKDILLQHQLQKALQRQQLRQLQQAQYSLLELQQQHHLQLELQKQLKLQFEGHIAFTMENKYDTLFSKLCHETQHLASTSAVQKTGLAEKFSPSEGQKDLLNYCSIKNFKNPPTFDSKDEVQQYVNAFVQKRDKFRAKYNYGPATRKAKVVLDFLGIIYKDQEFSLTNIAARRLMRTKIEGKLTAIQMYDFIITIGIQDISKWKNLDFEQAQEIIKKMKDAKAKETEEEEHFEDVELVAEPPFK